MRAQARQSSATSAGVTGDSRRRYVPPEFPIKASKVVESGCHRMGISVCSIRGRGVPRQGQTDPEKIQRASHPPRHRTGVRSLTWKIVEP
jgi:hypothetical protein